MTTLDIIAIVLIVWGALCVAIGVFKPRALWKTGKLQGFVQILSDRGTQIFLIVIGVSAIVGGVLILT
jgi:hypothetical protein